MNKKEWINQVTEWKIKYNVKQEVIKYEPCKIRLACKKCGKLKAKMSRHHKCNDYLFANLLPDVYAKRYLEYRDGDVDKLCESCHRRWHEYIKPFLKILYKELSNLKHVTEEWCEHWRRQILARYEKWMTIIPKNQLRKRI